MSKYAFQWSIKNICLPENAVVTLLEFEAYQFSITTMTIKLRNPFHFPVTVDLWVPQGVHVLTPTSKGVYHKLLEPGQESIVYFYMSNVFYVIPEIYHRFSDQDYSSCQQPCYTDWSSALYANWEGRMNLLFAPYDLGYYNWLYDNNNNGLYPKKPIPGFDYVNYVQYIKYDLKFDYMQWDDITQQFIKKTREVKDRYASFNINEFIAKFGDMHTITENDIVPSTSFRCYFYGSVQATREEIREFIEKKEIEFFKQNYNSETNFKFTFLQKIAIPITIDHENEGNFSDTSFGSLSSGFTIKIC